LLLDSGSHGAQVKLGLPFDEDPDDIKAGTCGATEFAQSKNDGSLVLIGDTDAPDNRGAERNCGNGRNRVRRNEIY
jgi:hypothetical protein